MEATSNLSFSKKICLLGYLVMLLVGGCQCGKKLPAGANFFTLDDDKKMGKIVTLDFEREARILPEASNPLIYNYLNRLRDRILATGRVAHARDFDWKIKVMHDDEIENAFCAPGGSIFIFTGLLKLVDSEDQLAGVLAHEIAHAAERHYTRQVTRTMPARRITEALLGNADGMKMIAVGLAGLRYNREFESEADEKSVEYLCSLGIRADGAKGFFKKIENMPGLPPQWLSTHPNPTNRIAHIEEVMKNLGCRGTQTDSREFREAVAALPED